MLNQTQLEWHVKLQNQSQTFLDLSHRQLKDEQLYKILNYKWEHLTGINFSNNAISSNGIKNIVGMKCNSNLRSLNLSDNNIDSQGLLILSQVVWEKLEGLDLSSNKIVLVQWKAKNFPNLKELKLQSNQIVQFPPDIIELQNIETLYLPANKISSIPDTLLKLNKLRTFYIGGNKLQQSAIPLIIQLRQKKCNVSV